MGHPDIYGTRLCQVFNIIPTFPLIIIIKGIMYSCSNHSTLNEYRSDYLYGMLMTFGYRTF